MVGMNFFAEQNHLSERGRAMSFANADALGRPRRSVLPLARPHAILNSTFNKASSPTLGNTYQARRQRPPVRSQSNEA
jgi:hypothetical protein